MVRIRDSKLEIDSGLIEELKGWKINALSGNSSTDFCVATCSNELGQWQLVGIDSKSGIRWKYPIDSQYIENAVEPLVWNSESGAVICENGRIYLFDSTGVFAGLLSSVETHGFAMNWTQETLLISDGRRVSAWKIREGGVKAIPASTRLKGR